MSGIKATVKDGYDGLKQRSKEQKVFWNKIPEKERES